MAPEQIRQRLEATGLRCTAQRYSVMSFLLTHHEHPTAAEIYEAVNSADPRSSRATTYNNLRDLVTAGLVRQVAAEGRAARYDARDEHHHHFICDRCGNVEDIQWHTVKPPTPPNPRQTHRPRVRAHRPRPLRQVRPPQTPTHFLLSLTP